MTIQYDPQKEAVESLLTEVVDMDMNALIRSVPDVLEFVPDIESVEYKQVRAAFLSRAAELNDRKLIRSIFVSCEKKARKLEKIETVRFNRETQIAYLDYDEKGAPKDCIENFMQIMLCDPFYRSVRYNLLTNQAEVLRMDRNGHEILTAWGDTEDAESRNFIETEYHLYSPQKHTDALKMLFKRREYNPIIDLIESLQWDGETVWSMP